MNAKPLPAIPKRPASATAGRTLSVDARAHLARFIRTCSLAEDSVTSFGVEGAREDWSNAIESALHELGDAAVRGGWVTGLRRTRKAWKARRDAQRKELLHSKKEETISSKKQPKQSTCTEKPQPNPPADLAPQIAQLRTLVDKPPTPKPTSKHLLLSVAPIGSRIEIPQTDGDFDLVPANIACVFVPGKFMFPEPHIEEDVVLYGLEPWNVSEFIPEDDTLRLVGGTFTFKGIISPTQHIALTKALRLSIYVFLSLLLETHVLVDSHAPVVFPKPSLGPKIPSYTSLPLSPPFSRKTTMSHGRNNSFTPTSIMSFFSKKTENLLQRKHSGTVADLLPGRRGSLDIQSQSGGISPASSFSSAYTRTRRFSFMSDASSSTKAAESVVEGADKPFGAALERIEKAKGILSSSAGVSFPPPVLLESLATKERVDPTRRIRGDEKAGLKTILGWEKRSSRGVGMVGTLGFVRHQELSVLFSQHVPSTAQPPPPAEGDSGSVQPFPMVRCDKARWATFRYYSRGPALGYSDKASQPERTDKTLGEAIIDWTDGADELCDVPSCQVKRGDHEKRFIHAGVKITLVITKDEAREEEAQGEGDGIEMWESCKICEAKTERKDMSEGSYLFSFAKYLELLVYSPAISSLSPTLCEHTDPPPDIRRTTSDGPTSPLSQSSTDTAGVGSTSKLPESRLNIVRHFSHGSHTASLTLCNTAEIFELGVPRLQISKHSDRPLRNSLVKDEPLNGDNAEGEKKALRKEIVKWWQSLADHLDKLEETVNVDDVETFKKHLPRLPSSDAAFEEEDEDDVGESTGTTTPKASAIMPVTPKPIVTGLPALGTPMEGPSREYFLPIKGSKSKEPPADPVQSLTGMRHAFQRAEQEMLARLPKTTVATLNDIRREFLWAARGATKRLGAWQSKHVSGTAVENFSGEEPEWWKKGYHIPPGTNVLIREDDWGSIIAFTIGTPDYQQEMSSMSVGRSSAVSLEIPSTRSKLTRGLSDAMFPTSLFSTAPKLDPDQDGVVWYEPDLFYAEVSRQENPRDALSILSVGRGSVRSGRSDVASNPQLSRMFGSMGTAASKIAAPPSAWSKPAAEISMFVADGNITGLPAADTAREILHDIDSASMNSRSSSLSGSTSSLNLKSSKVASILSTQSDSTIEDGDEDDGSKTPPPLPPKDSSKSSSRASSSPLSPNAPAASSSYFSAVGSIGSGLARAMKYVRQEPERPSSSLSKTHHGLLTIDASAIDEKPHIRYEFSIGKGTQFSCTSYYAKQFDTLRRRCGIEDTFLKSLGKSTNWAAEGGKSKSNFWKTSDDRFIIKTLVNAWNVADLQVLIELAPSYFKYMEATASQATVLAKLIGFYTVEVTVGGTVQAKADLLVMENLFHDRQISKTFDLKGIQGRKVKAGANSESDAEKKTLFDGEWIEGLQRTLMLVQPHSKAVLQEAIKSDCDFLTKSNIMDYSLLLGVDVEHKQIACGLVDTIGSFTFAKTLESKAKQGFNAGKEVTILPPLEYQQRFMSALDGYFLACPDKWSRSLDDTRTVTDVNQLPSVL